MRRMIATLRPWRWSAGPCLSSFVFVARALSPRNSDRHFSIPRFCRVAQNIFQDSMNDEIWITPDRRREMGISRRRQREVAHVFLRIARLVQRTQHQVGKNPFCRLAGNLLRQLLVHARCNVHFFRDFNFPRALARAVTRAAIRLGLYPLNGQRTDAQRVAESRGNDFKVVNALGVWLLVYTV